MTISDLAGFSLLPAEAPFSRYWDRFVSCVSGFCISQISKVHFRTDLPDDLSGYAVIINGVTMHLEDPDTIVGALSVEIHFPCSVGNTMNQPERIFTEYQKLFIAVSGGGGLLCQMMKLTSMPCGAMVIFWRL